MRVPIAVLGCTGLVGQKIVELLKDHPLLELTELRASESSAGLEMEGIRVESIDVPIKSPLVLSALPAEVARSIEPRLAQKGKIILTKSSAMRMEPDVPILIPEVNPEHLGILEVQRRRRKQRGAIITDPNCTTTFLAMVLKPLDDRFGVKNVLVTTMQALSGAGKRGVAALQIADNVLPHIAGEEGKVETETLKILGRLEGKRISPAEMLVRAACHRVNVTDGHLETVHVCCAESVDLGEAKRALRSFTGLPQRLRLPLAPERPLIVREEEDRPQPRLDREAGRGMSVTIGRLRRGMDDKSLLMDILGHNLVRGAAGASVLDAELLIKTGRLRELLEGG